MLDYQEYYDRITKNQDDLDMVWKLGRELDMSHLWNEPEDFDKNAKYFNPLKKEMQKYPLLEGINTNKVCESDLSAYIDMVELSHSKDTDCKLEVA